MWTGVIFGIILIGNLAKQRLKRAGASKGTNYTLTILLIIMLTFAFLGVFTFYIIRNGIDDGRTPVGHLRFMMNQCPSMWKI